eukprot:SAG31_NODE_17419_length_671_cov_0.982517_1_plen_173_part_01
MSHTRTPRVNQNQYGKLVTSVCVSFARGRQFRDSGAWTMQNRTTLTCHVSAGGLWSDGSSRPQWRVSYRTRSSRVAATTVATTVGSGYPATTVATGRHVRPAGTGARSSDNGAQNVAYQPITNREVYLGLRYGWTRSAYNLFFFKKKQTGAMPRGLADLAQECSVCLQYIHPA